MNIDSIKVKFPIHCLTDYKRSAFKDYTEDVYNDSGELSDSKTYKKLIGKKHLGLKDIALYETSGNVTVEMSAKILKENYFSLINLNTIENVFQNINALGLIEINVPESIGSAAVLKCDVTTDLYIEDIPRYIRSLSAYKVNQKYDCEIYPTSIVFDKRVKTPALREYLTFYDKATELKRDRELLKYVPIKDAKNKLRSESRCTNLQQIRNAIEQTDLSLLSVLESEGNPNLKIFNRITQGISEVEHNAIENFQKLIDMKKTNYHKDIRNALGDNDILKLCNYDIELVKIYLATNSTANNSRLLRHLKSRLKAKNEFESAKTIETDIQEIRSLLSIA